MKDCKRGVATMMLLLTTGAWMCAAPLPNRLPMVKAVPADSANVVDSIWRNQNLGEVTVTAVVRKNTDAALLNIARKSDVVMSTVSSQEIKRTQDSNAGEVIRRVPGVSLIDDKFVMVRGLSQRYNNVWINGGAVPSSEADSRAFSFDLIPSSQLDNLMIVKTPSAEYPADYTGGFILINTKEIPTSNSLNISVGGNWNSQSAFRSMLLPHGTFDSYPTRQDVNLGNVTNDWTTKSVKPFGDLRLGADWSHRWDLAGRKLGMIASVNYSREYRRYTGMLNNLFGVYDVENNNANYLRHSVDDQYNLNNRLGAMFNVTLLSKNGKHKYQLKNIFNRIGNLRYTWRDGFDAQSDPLHSAEYYKRSRVTYNGQITGTHTFSGDALDWSVGYAYANRRMPDRKRYTQYMDVETNDYALLNGNDISREWTSLDEHIFSAQVNDEHKFSFGSWQPKLKVGAYGEYRTRKYKTRDFYYLWDTYNNTLPSDFRQMDLQQLLSDNSYFGADKLFLQEQVNWQNNYNGHNTLGAGYLSAALPFGKLDIHAGVRFEFNQTELISNTRSYEESHMSNYYRHGDFFPSLNMTYRFDDRNQLRLSYGRSVNRPEFRELSSSVYYDFDLASDVIGNVDLKNCYVNNIDLRYEWYPHRGEVISLAAFYKHFQNPIEWTYTVAGGTDLIYSNKNAKAANNFGLELDIRKQLDFIGLRNFSWSFNGALIHSRVTFPAGSLEESRPMQGQSPYLINTGLFYRNPKLYLNIALLYNRIGKRIIGVGRTLGASGSEEAAHVPNSYEMPRDAFDFTATKSFGEHWELKFYVRDLLNQNVCYKQFAKDSNGGEVQEIVRQYKPGRNIGLMLTLKL
ncbi:TonB-dependent receptor domain-containing protein [Prevotella sp. AGR2160]|uniref:TonB-dependent receptor domain-containing protein n=1 Tax=Prevotella sp. AGR2160 TaxID=1280674 RepID=UPI00040B5795|nr:TonB-dependent receptor [Prevotella sp. AGR2160]